MLGRILEFYCTLAALIVGSNVAVRWGNAPWSSDDAFSTLPLDASCIGAAVYILASLPTPFLLKDEIDSIYVGTAAIVLSGARVINSPGILTESLNTILSRNLEDLSELMSLVGVTDDVIIDPDTVLHSSGATIIELILIAKCTLLVGGLYLYIVQLKKNNDYIGWNFILLIPFFGALALYFNMERFFTIEMNGNGPSAVQILIGDEHLYLLTYFDEVSLLLSICLCGSCAIFNHKIVPFVATYVYSNLTLRYHMEMNDSYPFVIAFVLSVLFMATAIISSIRMLLSTHLHDLLFRLSVAASFLSICYFFYAVNLPWYHMTMKLNIIPDELIAVANKVIKLVGEIVSILYKIATGMNPCTKKIENMPKNQTLHIPGISDDYGYLPDGSIGITEHQIDVRKQLYGMPGTDQCFVKPIDTSKYTFDTNEASHNDKCKNTYEAQVMELKSQETLNESQQNLTERNYTFKDGPDDEPDEEEEKFFNDPNCEIAKCAIIGGFSVAAMAAAVNPFGGGFITYALKTTGSIMHAVFRMAKLIIKNLPSLRRKRKRILKLITMIKSFMVPSTSTSSFSVKMLLLLLSILISFTVVLIFVLFRSKRRLNFDSIIGNIIAILAPVVLLNLACLAMVWFLPMLIHDIFEQLPSFIRGELVMKEGYYSLRLSNVFSASAPALILLSELVYLFNLEVAYVLSSIRDSCLSRVRKYNNPNKPLVSSSNNYNSNRERLCTKFSYLFGIFGTFTRFIANVRTSEPRFVATVVLCQIAIAIILESYFNTGAHRFYIDIGFGSDETVPAYVDHFSSFNSSNDKSHAVSESMNDEFCGIDGATVKSVVEVLFIPLQLILFAFTESYKLLIQFAKDILNLFSDLIGLGFVRLMVENIEKYFGKTVAYAVPGTLLVWLMWIMIRAIADNSTPSTSELLGIVWLSMSNIIFQVYVQSIFNMIERIKIPFLRFSFEAGYDLYASIFCSVLVIMAVFGIYFDSLMQYYSVPDDDVI